MKTKKIKLEELSNKELIELTIEKLMNSTKEELEEMQKSEAFKEVKRLLDGLKKDEDEESTEL